MGHSDLTVVNRRLRELSRNAALVKPSPVTLKVRTPLLDGHADHAYFMEEGLASVVLTLAGGRKQAFPSVCAFYLPPELTLRWRWQSTGTVVNRRELQAATYRIANSQQQFSDTFFWLNSIYTL